VIAPVCCIAVAYRGERLLVRSMKLKAILTRSASGLRY
jgi:hypothetical protein